MRTSTTSILCNVIIYQFSVLSGYFVTDSIQLWEVIECYTLCMESSDLYQILSLIRDKHDFWSYSYCLDRSKVLAFITLGY